MADLTGSTGQNDASSVWGSGLLSTISDLANTGVRTYNAVTNKPSTPTPTPTAAAPASTWTKYLPWVIGGVVLLVVLGFVFRSK